MKKIILAILALMLVLSLAACGNYKVEIKENESPAEIPATENPKEENESGISESGQSTASSGNTVQDFYPADVLTFSVPLSNGGYPIGFSINAPSQWNARENAIYEGDRMVAQMLSAYPSSEAESLWATLDERHSNAEPAQTVTCGDYKARYYWLQTEVNEGGVSGFINELMYYLTVDNIIIEMKFIPARGIGGISTQREDFEKLISSIKIS